ncbi:MAG: NAD(P)-dependent oxidoreductase, partial [Colwellia sp.]|nr:NAD(P)-dependent oxidoreductase [Colwellia sp.]
TSAVVAREIAAAAASKQIAFLDAPLSGGQAGAETGQLTIMLGGDSDAYERTRPVIYSYAKSTTLIGTVGSGQLAKMVNQICIAGLVQGLAEGLNFAEKAGLNADALVETISKGAAGSWQMENRYKTMFAGEYDFGFAVDWMRKDLAIAFDEAKKNGASLPVTKMVDGYYQEIQENGGNRWDTSSLISRFKDPRFTDK